ncbi:MAG: hypothetical protein Tsb0016_16590 [Sphingomonadales bacterium]
MRLLRMLLLGLVMALPAPAATAQDVSALRQHDVEQPIDIAADRVEVREKQNEALFEGAVEVRQGDMTMQADSLKVFYNRDDQDRLTIERLDAEGHVVLRSATETASGDWGIYDVASRLITLGGDVQMTRGESRIWGERLELNLESGLTTLDGASRREDRVKGRFQVPQKAQPPGQ